MLLPLPSPHANVLAIMVLPKYNFSQGMSTGRRKSARGRHAHKQKLTNQSWPVSSVQAEWRANWTLLAVPKLASKEERGRERERELDGLGNN